jgi:hypothetical protein
VDSQCSGRTESSPPLTYLFSTSLGDRISDLRLSELCFQRYARRGNHRLCQEMRCWRRVVPSTARVPMPGLAIPTELQRSRKQQKTGRIAPMLSGSVARQELEQERVTMGLWMKGYSVGQAGIRAHTCLTAYPPLCALAPPTSPAFPIPPLTVTYINNTPAPAEWLQCPGLRP